MCTSPDPGLALVAGAAGFLGRRLADAWAAAGGRVARGLRKGGPNALRVDLAAPGEAELPGGVTVAFLAGAVTGIGACEADPAGTARVNVAGTLELARRLAGQGALVAWFSSDYVFDGRRGGYPDDAMVHPLNEYGRQKAHVEAELPAATGGRCLILRLSKLYGLAPGDGTLLDEMAARLRAGREVRAAADQVFCPTLGKDAAAAALALVRAGATGLYNVCAPRAVSRLDVARDVARALGADPGLVLPIRLADLGESFTRPLDTSLACIRLGAESPMPFFSLDQALARLPGTPASPRS